MLIGFKELEWDDLDALYSPPTVSDVTMMSAGDPYMLQSSSPLLYERFLKCSLGFWSSC